MKKNIINKTFQIRFIEAFQIRFIEANINTILNDSFQLKQLIMSVKNKHVLSNSIFDDVVQFL